MSHIVKVPEVAGFKTWSSESPETPSSNWMPQEQVIYFPPQKAAGMSSSKEPSFPLGTLLPLAASWSQRVSGVFCTMCSFNSEHAGWSCSFDRINDTPRRGSLRQSKAESAFVFFLYCKHSDEDAQRFLSLIRIVVHVWSKLSTPTTDNICELFSGLETGMRRKG